MEKQLLQKRLILKHVFECNKNYFLNIKHWHLNNIQHWYSESITVIILISRIFRYLEKNIKINVTENTQ